MARGKVALVGLQPQWPGDCPCQTVAAENPDVAERLGKIYQAHVAEIKANQRPTAPMPRPANAKAAARP